MQAFITPFTKKTETTTSTAILNSSNKGHPLNKVENYEMAFKSRSDLVGKRFLCIYANHCSDHCSDNNNNSNKRRSLNTKLPKVKKWCITCLPAL